MRPPTSGHTDGCLKHATSSRRTAGHPGEPPSCDEERIVVHAGECPLGEKPNVEEDLELSKAG